MKGLARFDKQLLRRNNWRLAVFALALVIMALNTVRLYHTMPFTSDGVYVQNFASVLQNHVHQQAIFNEDSYLLKVPFYWLVTHVGLSPLQSLWATFITFIVFAYFGFYIGVALLNRIFNWFNEKYFAIGFLYLVSLSRPYEYMMIPNTRNVEIGLSFLLLVPLAVAFTKGRLSKVWQVATVLVLSLLLFEDPYFLFVLFLPLLALIVISGLLVKKRGGHWLSAGLLVVSAVLAKLWGFIARKLGIFLNNLALQFVGWGNALINLKASAAALLLLAGATYYSGSFHLESLSFYVNATVIVLLMAYSLGFIILHLKKIKTEPWKIFIVSTPWIICLLFYLQPSQLTTNYRYMLIAAFGFPIILAFLWRGLKSRAILTISVAGIVFATLVNIQYSSQALSQHTASNIINAQIAKEVKALGLTKGYADYWDGNINTYFAGGKIYFLPVTCTNGRLQPFYWLVDSGEFTKVKAPKTFYLYNTQGYYTNKCTPDSLVSVYGKPAMVKTINNQYKIVIYDYDLNSKMHYNFPRY